MIPRAALEHDCYHRDVTMRCVVQPFVFYTTQSLALGVWGVRSSLPEGSDSCSHCKGFSGARYDWALLAANSHGLWEMGA